MKKMSIRPLRGLSAAVWFAAAAAAVNAQPAPSGTDALRAELEMPGRSAPFRAMAELFVARAHAGDLPGSQALLSQALVERSGEAGIRRALEAQILPFFQHGRELGRSVTVAQTTDAAGQTGYAFYFWLQPQDGSALRPFSVYVVQERGRLVIANIVPDRRVEGRHR
jgi:hypothetical protein